MTAAAVLRVKALHKIHEIRAQGRHDLRQYQPANADPARKHLNQILVGNPNDDMGQIAADKIGDQRLRKDARRAATFIFSASREAFEDEDGNLDQDRINEFKDRVMDFAQTKLGPKENIISAVMHLDEITPHIQMIIIPLRENGTLSYKDSPYGGDRGKLRQLQTDFAKALEPMGIVRGQKFSTAKHETVKEYYTRVNAAEAAIPSLDDVEEPEPAEVFLPNKFLGYSLNESRQALDDARQIERDKVEKIREAALTELAKAQEMKRKAVAMAYQKYQPAVEENDTLKEQLQIQAERLAAAEKQAQEAKKEIEKQAELRKEIEEKNGQIEKMEEERVEIANAILYDPTSARNWAEEIMEDEDDQRTGPE